MLWELFLREQEILQPSPPKKSEFFEFFQTQKLRWKKKAFWWSQNTLFQHFKNQMVCLGAKTKVVRF